LASAGWLLQILDDDRGTTGRVQATALANPHGTPFKLVRLVGKFSEIKFKTKTYRYFKINHINWGLH